MGELGHHDRKRPVRNRPLRKRGPHAWRGREEEAGWKPGPTKEGDSTREGARVIADVVTGKVDVREAAAGLGDEGEDALGDGEGLA